MLIVIIVSEVEYKYNVLCNNYANWIVLGNEVKIGVEAEGSFVKMSVFSLI